MAIARSASPQPLTHHCAGERPFSNLGIAFLNRLLTTLPVRAGAGLFVLVLAGSFAWASSASAGQTPSSPQDLKGLSLEQLGNVEVVTYSKSPDELLKIPAAIYVITSQDILRSGATTIADALRLAPGVEVGRMSSDYWAIGIRGLQNNFSKSVLVLIDGRNVYTPLFAGTYWDVQDMPLADIDRIEVIRGPGGTIWGPNAANGVINIITKKSADTQGVMADTLGGSQDHTVDDLQIGAAPRSQLTFRAFGRGFERAHEYHSDHIDEDSWHQERVGVRADYSSGRDRYFAEGDAYRGDAPRIVTATPLDDQTAGGDVNVRWERQLSPANGFYLQVYFDRTLRTDSRFFGESRNTIDVDFIHHLALPGRQQFSYGGGLRWSPYNTIPAYPGANLLVPPRGTDHVHTGFLQDEIDLPRHLSLTGGAKLTENNYTGLDLQPSVRLLWTPNQRQSLWGGITRAVTTPSDLEEKFFLQGEEAPNLYIQVLGNKHFKSEDVIGYEAGYRLLEHNRLYLDIATFWNQYSRTQSFSAPSVSTANGNTYISILYTNQITGHTTGFEFAPRLTLAPWWHFDTSYSFVSSTFSAGGPTADISASGSINTYEKSTPRHQVVFESKVDLPRHIQFDQTFRYASDLPAQKVPAYETMDLRLARPIGSNLALEAVGQNLFEEHHYEWGTGDPNQHLVGIDRAAYVRLSFHTNPRPPQYAR